MFNNVYSQGTFTAITDMIQSMTGYGSGVAFSESYRVTVELKSLNGKYFDLSAKLPAVYAKYELKLRNYLASQLQRGKVMLQLNVEVLSSGIRKLHINKVLAESYLLELNELRRELGIQKEVELPYILALPEVIPQELAVEDQEEWDLVEEATQIACRELIQNRNDEGGALNEDLVLRCKNIEEYLTEVEILAPQRTHTIKNRISQSLEEIKPSLGDLDENRFEQELLYYLERLDITEEVVRLKQHLQFFDELRVRPDSMGKQLTFLSQEMGREINTMGAKANDARIQRLVVQMKDELEKIKEQVQNII